MQQMREVALQSSVAPRRCQPISTGLPITQEALYSTFEHSTDDDSMRALTAFGRAVTRAERNKSVAYSIAVDSRVSTQTAARALYQVCSLHSCRAPAAQHWQLQEAYMHMSVSRACVPEPGYVPAKRLSLSSRLQPFALLTSRRHGRTATSTPDVAQGLGCDGSLAGSCRVLDVAAAPAAGPEQAAHIHSLAAQQLQSKPDSVFIVLHSEQLKGDALAPMLQLLGARLLIATVMSAEKCVGFGLRSHSFMQRMSHSTSCEQAWPPASSCA